MKKIILILALIFTCIIYSFTVTFKMSDNKKNDSTIKKKPSISCVAPSMSLSAVTCLQSGNWDDSSTWSTNRVPTSADDVTIGMDKTVTLSGSIAANKIAVMGTLKPLTNTTNFNITTKGILVMGTNALFEIGTASAPYTGTATITLTGNDTAENLFGGAPSMGTKLVAAMGGGKLNMHGSVKKSWTNLNANAAANATTITVENSSGWQVNDSIVIVSSRNNWNEAERRKITAISADTKTLTLNAALVYPHCGTQIPYTRPQDDKNASKTWTADLRAEVGLLTHNIRIEGDAASQTNGFGGHMMVMDVGSSAYIENIELFRMGQKKRNARYPFHWHMLGEAGAGQYFKNNSEHFSYNRALTIHGTSNTTVENNFFYDHIGHGIFLENGSEIKNTIKGNVVLLTRRPKKGEELTLSDNQFDQFQNRTPASYWITNPNNNFTNNVAAGTEGTGFWYALATNFMFDSKDNPLFDGQKQPYKEVFGGFTGNKSHSCMNGFDIFDQLDANHSIVGNLGWEDASYKYFSNNTFYANHIGIYGGLGNDKNFSIGYGREYTKNVIFKDNMFIENNLGIMMAGYNLFDECLFVANSGQNLYSTSKSIFLFYDGAPTIQNSHFVNWNAPKTNLFSNVGADTKHVNFLFDNITFQPTVPINMYSEDFSKPSSSYVERGTTHHPQFWTIVFKDKSGSLTGDAEYNTLLCNHPFVLVGDEKKPANSRNMYSTKRSYALATLFYSGADYYTCPKLATTRTKLGTPTTSYYQLHGENIWNHKLPVIVNDGFLYTYQYGNLPVNKIITLGVNDANIGDIYMARYKDFGKLGGLNLSAATGTQYTTFAALQSATTSGYYIEPQGDLYIKTVATRPDQSYTVTWTTNFVVPALDSDGDGYTDSNEGTLNRMPDDASDLSFKFDTNKDGWETDGSINPTTCVPCDNSYKIISSGSNANIIKVNLNFDGNKVKTIFADMKSNLSGILKLYWTTQNEQSFDEDKFVEVNYSTINQRKVISFNLANHPKWKDNYITSLKLKTIIEDSTTWVYSISSGISSDADGDGMSDSEELVNCRDRYNAKDFNIDFDSSYDGTTTWTSANINDFVVNNGIASGNATGAGWFFKKNINFSGATVPIFKIKMRASAPTPVIVYWENEDGTYDVSRLSYKNYTLTNEWQEVVFDLSAKTSWTTKTIKSLRIQPVNNPTNTSFEIDWIRSNDHIQCSTTWNGTTWSSGAPTVLLDAVINAAYTTGSFSAKSVTVNASGSLTVATGTSVIIAGALTNNGTIIVQNNANLIQTAVTDTNSGTGLVTVNRDSNSLKRLDYTLWSTPVATGNRTLASFSPYTTPTKNYIYNPITDLYNSITNTVKFSTGTGYLIRMPDQDPSNLGYQSDYYKRISNLIFNGVFTGTALNNGSITISTNANTYNAIGNPYPSVISADDFLKANRTDGTLYFWRKTNAALGTAYARYTGVMGGVANGGFAPDGKIQVGQGFIVKATGTSLVFYNTMRSGSASSRFLKTKAQVEKSRVWLNLNNAEGMINQTLVGYLDGATLGVDEGIEGKSFGDGAIELASSIDGESYIIQGRPPFDATDVVALNFKTSVTGTYTIAIDHVDGLFSKGQDIYLVDKTTGVSTNLNEGAYTFTANVGVDNTRFTLTYQKTLNVDAPVFIENNILISISNGTLHIKSTGVSLNNVKVYDVQGRLIAELKNVKSNNAAISNLIANQVLIVKVTSENSAVVTKKVLN